MWLRLKTKKENLSFKIKTLEEFELEKIKDKKEELKKETNKLEIDNKYSIETKKMFIYNPELIVKGYIEDYDLSVKDFYFSIKEHNKPLYKRIELYYESYEDIINNKLKELQALIQKEKEVNKKIKDLRLKLKNFEKDINKQKNELNKEYKQIEKRLKTIKNTYEDLIVADITDDENEVRRLVNENKDFKKVNKIIKKYNLNSIKEIIKAIDKKIREIEKINEKNASLIEEKITKSNEKYILDTKIEKYEKAKEEIVEVERKIKEYEEKLSEIEIPDFNEITKREDEIDNELSNIEKLKRFIALKNDIKEIEERVFVYNKIKNFSKRIQEQLIEEYFKSIMEVANYILQNDNSNISKMQLELKVTKSILEFYVKDEKVTKRKLSTLSGGESVIVSKAISTAIALATNNNFNILLLDESDSKLTDENKFIFNEYIKKVLDLNINQIFIISHSDFIKGDENVFLVER
jgi:DNA repair exonuclease SbcCD ATPase subunit